MADRCRTLEARDRLAVRERIADEAGPTLGVEDGPVEGDDAGRLLAAMLKGVEPERDDGGGVGMAEDTEDAAFLAQRVAVAVEPVRDLDRGASVRLGY